MIVRLYVYAPIKVYATTSFVYGLIPLTISPHWVCFTVKTEFSYFLQTGLWGLMCKYEYMYFWEDDPVISPLRPLFSGNKWLVVILLLIIHHSFQFEVTRILHFCVARLLQSFGLYVYTTCFTTSRLYFYVFHLCYTEKRRQYTKYL